MADEDLDRVLTEEQLQLSRDKEIKRIISCCKWDYFAILDIDPIGKFDQVSNIAKKAYRKKSLFVHPDKTKHRDAPLAFDRLKKAQSVLLQDDLELAQNAPRASDDFADRYLVEQKLKLVAIYKDVHSKLVTTDLEPNETLTSNDLAKLRREAARILTVEMKHEQIERDFVQQQEARKLAEAKIAQDLRENKRKFDNQWEDQRDERVNNWRTYTSKSEKNRVKKPKKNAKGKAKLLA